PAPPPTPPLFPYTTLFRSLADDGHLLRRRLGAHRADAAARARAGACHEEAVRAVRHRAERQRRHRALRDAGEGRVADGLGRGPRSEEHTSELQSLTNLVSR